MTSQRRDGTSQPLEDKCLDCGLTADEGFPLSEWAALCDACETNPAMNAIFEQSNEVRQNRQPANFRKQEVDTGRKAGYKVYCTMIVFTPEEFKSFFNNKAPRQVPGVVVDKSPIWDQFGTKIETPIFVQDTSDPRFTSCRRVEVWHEVTDSSLTERWHTMANQLRKDQGLEMHEFLKMTLESKRPARLRKGQQPQTAEAILTAVGMSPHPARTEVAGPPQPAPAASGTEGGAASAGGGPMTPLAHAPLSTVGSDGEEDGDGEQEEDAEVIVTPGGVMDMSIMGLQSNRKGRGRGKGGRGGNKGSGAAGSAVPSPTASISSRVDGLPAGSPSKLATNTTQYITVLDISKALTGQALGSELYQARRTLHAMDGKAELNSEFVALKTHIGLVDSAMQLKPDNIIGSKITKQVREEHVRKLLQSDKSFHWPALTQAAFVIQAAAEVKVTLNAGQIAEWVGIANPVPPNGIKLPFDPFHPRLADCTLDAAAEVKVLHRIVVDEWLLTSFKLGAKYAAEHMNTVLAQLIEAFGKVMDHEDDDEPLLPIQVTAFVKDLLALSKIVLAVNSPRVRSDTSVDELINFLSDNPSKKLSKTGKILKDAMKLDSYWSERLKTWQGNQDAIVLHGKSISDALDMMQGSGFDPTVVDIKPVAMRLAEWVSSLPQACTQDVVAKLHEVVRQAYDVHVKDKQASAEVLQKCSQLKVVVDTAAPPLGPGSQMQALKGQIDSQHKLLTDALQSGLVAAAIDRLTTNTSWQGAEALTRLLCGATSAFEPPPLEALTGCARACASYVCDAVRTGGIIEIEQVEVYTATADSMLKLQQVFENIVQDCVEFTKMSAIKKYLQLAKATMLFKSASSDGSATFDEDLHMLGEAFAAVEGLLVKAPPTEPEAEGDEDDIGQHPLSEVASVFAVNKEEAKECLATGAASSLADLKGAVEKKMAALDLIKNGALDRASWKDGLASDASLQVVAEHAKKTIAAEDQVLAKNITSAFNALKGVAA